MSKNRIRKANLSPAMFALLVLTAISLATTGIVHTVMKNRQLQVVREIESVERRMKEKDRDITNLEIRISQLENRWGMRDALDASGTALCQIPIESIIDISAVVAMPEMASND